VTVALPDPQSAGSASSDPGGKSIALFFETILMNLEMILIGLKSSTVLASFFFGRRVMDAWVSLQT
jgi:hypothetical protein